MRVFLFSFIGFFIVSSDVLSEESKTINYERLAELKVSQLSYDEAAFLWKILQGYDAESAQSRQRSFQDPYDTLAGEWDEIEIAFERLGANYRWHKAFQDLRLWKFVRHLWNLSQQASVGALFELKYTLIALERHQWGMLRPNPVSPCVALLSLCWRKQRRWRDQHSQP